MLERCIVLVFFLSPVRASVNAPACRVPGYDLRNLTKRIWTLKTSEGCLFPEAMNKSSQGRCSYYLSFCQMLQIPGNCMNASVCQVLSSNYSIKLGSYARNPFKKDYRAGLKAEFQNGELYNKCKLSMTLNFHCNSNAFWELQNRKKSLQIIPFSESNFHVVFIKRTCQFLAQVQYAGACEAVTESPEKEQHHLEGLTVGTILTIILYFWVAGGLVVRLQSSMGWVWFGVLSLGMFPLPVDHVLFSQVFLCPVPVLLNWSFCQL